MTLTTIGVSALVFVLVAVGILLRRNELVCKWRCRANRDGYERAIAAIGTPEEALAYDRWLIILDRRSYDAMLFDLTRWSYESFFPEYAEKK